MHSRAEIRGVLAENVRFVVEDADETDLDEQKSMTDYGADSLESIEIISRTLKQLGAKVSRTELSAVDNIGELVTLIEKAVLDAVPMES
jgi:acyl carrier protein